MSEYPVKLEDRAVGRLFWVRDGLYRRYDAVLDAGIGVRRLALYDAQGCRCPLGIPVPEGGTLRLRGRVSETQLGHAGFSPEDPLTARLEPLNASPASVGTVCGSLSVSYRASPPALLEPFDPKAPVSLAAWFARLRVETTEGRRFLVLDLSPEN